MGGAPRQAERALQPSKQTHHRSLEDIPMSRSTIVIFVTLSTLAALALGPDARAEEESDEALVGCRVTYELEARPRRGAYDHVVLVDSSCDFALACSITSDEAHQSEVVLAPEGDEAVTIDEGEARADFRATIRCLPVEDA